VSLMTKKQVSGRSARRGSRSGGARGRAVEAQRRAREVRVQQSVRARQAAAQMAPLARSAQASAKQSVYGARVWAAPRLERMGQALQDRVAPRMCAMMSAAARRIEPARSRRRRWPVLLAGLVALVGGTTAAALLRSRRSPGSVTATGRTGEMAKPSADSREMSGAESASTDVNGHIHTP
jgi:hypothetical protein